MVEIQFFCCTHGYSSYTNSIQQKPKRSERISSFQWETLQKCSKIRIRVSQLRSSLNASMQLLIKRPIHKNYYKNIAVVLKDSEDELWKDANVNDSMKNLGPTIDRLSYQKKQRIIFPVEEQAAKISRGWTCKFPYDQSQNICNRISWFC